MTIFFSLTERKYNWGNITLQHSMFQTWTLCPSIFVPTTNVLASIHSISSASSTYSILSNTSLFPTILFLSRIHHFVIRIEEFVICSFIAFRIQSLSFSFRPYFTYHSTSSCRKWQDSIFISYVPEAFSIICIYSHLLQTPPYCFPQWQHQITFPPTGTGLLYSPHRPTTPAISLLFDTDLTGGPWSLLVACICISLIISDDNFFLYAIFGGVSIQILCPLLKRLCASPSQYLQVGRQCGVPSISENKYNALFSPMSSYSRCGNQVD